jgi:hypothetical protein
MADPHIQQLTELGSREQAALDWEASTMLTIKALLDAEPSGGNLLRRTNRLVALVWRVYKLNGGWRG